VGTKQARWLLEKAFEKFTEDDLEYDLVEKKKSYTTYPNTNGSTSVKYRKITTKIFDKVTTEVRSFLGTPVEIKTIYSMPKVFSISTSEFRKSFFYVVYSALSGKFTYANKKEGGVMDFYKYVYFNYKGNIFKLEYTYGGNNSYAITFIPVDKWVNISSTLVVHDITSINEEVSFFYPEIKTFEIVA